MVIKQTNKMSILKTTIWGLSLATRRVAIYLVKIIGIPKILVIGVDKLDIGHILDVHQTMWLINIKPL